MKKSLSGVANGVEYQLQLRGELYQLRFTDPRRHEQKRVPTKKNTLAAAHGFATRYFKDYVPGESHELTVGQLVEKFLAFQQVRFPVRNRKARTAWDTRMKDKFAHIDARAKATANRDLAVLTGAYTYGRDKMEFHYRPKFEKLDESDNVREGFLLQHEFDAVRDIVIAMGQEFLLAAWVPDGRV